jgi:hypothetical protein
MPAGKGLFGHISTGFGFLFDPGNETFQRHGNQIA